MTPVRAKPDSRPRLEGARYRNTRQAAHSYLIGLIGYAPLIRLRRRALYKFVLID